MNEGFGFYRSFWETIKALPEDKQQAACFAICQYGITGEMVDIEKNPIGYGVTQSVKRSIDGSVSRWNNNIQRAEVRHNMVESRNMDIEGLIKEGKNSREIGEILGMSDSAVRKTDAWKNRNKIGKTSPADLF